MGKLVVVVDQESSCCKINAKFLKKLGYDTLSFLSGKEALDMLTSKKYKIALLFIEAILHTMTGKETYIKLKEHYPDLRVLYTSGFNFTDVQDEKSNCTIENFIQKPYTFIQLFEKLKSLKL